MTKEQKLCDYLKAKHVGHDKAVHSKKLEKRFGICPRTVRTYVNNLRKSGEPICSDDTGYWIAKDPKEARKTVKRLDNFVGEVNSARTGHRLDSTFQPQAFLQLIYHLVLNY